MVYILSAQLDADIPGYGAFDNYRAYLSEVGSQLPPGARSLANSDWYFNSTDHRAPHDAWLETAAVTERAHEDGRREVTILLTLLGAYHDGHIQLRYRDVRSYRIELSAEPIGDEASTNRGHRDWRYDEFRVASPGRVEHEIEWWGMRPTGSWLIDAADVEYQWLAFPSSDSSSHVI